MVILSEGDEEYEIYDRCEACFAQQAATSKDLFTMSSYNFSVSDNRSRARTHARTHTHTQRVGAIIFIDFDPGGFGCGAHCHG